MVIYASCQSARILPFGARCGVKCVSGELDSPYVAPDCGVDLGEHPFRHQDHPPLGEAGSHPSMPASRRGG